MKMETSPRPCAPDHVVALASQASPEVFQQLGAITRLLHDTMQQLGVMPKLQVPPTACPTRAAA
jgi:chemotaxis regulatin CheY-phosphate phosphatase CheZ